MARSLCPGSQLAGDRLAGQADETLAQPFVEGLIFDEPLAGAALLEPEGQHLISFHCHWVPSHCLHGG